MTKKDSIQKRLEKVRPPRVQLTYDVEIGDSVEQKELAFVAGVLGDFVGDADPNKPLERLKDRQFVSVDLDTLDDVMKGMSPRASYRVKNKLSQSGGEFAVNLEFNRMDDFRPESVVQQIDPLRKLLDARAKLADLRNKLAGNDKLEDILGDVLSSTEKLELLGAETQAKE